MTADTPDPRGPFPGFHLAQVNIGVARLPLEAPEMADFTRNLAHVNGLGKKAPGFVWLLEGEDSAYGATDVAWPGRPDMLVNMSVWESLAALRQFVLTGQHRELLARRREFFVKQAEHMAVLWWIPAGTVPTVQEAHERLARLNAEGPTPYAFTFTRTFTP